MKLPDIVETPLGLAAQGASPGLLADLLDEFQNECLLGGFDLNETFEPGVSADEVLETWAPHGVTPPAEALTMWQWKGGYKQLGLPVGAGELTPRAAADMYGKSFKGDGEYDWNAAWMPFWHTALFQLAMDTTATNGSPLVRSTYRGLGTAAGDTEHQVVSLCTPLTFWLTGLSNGWGTWSPTGWHLDVDAMPSAWLKTELAFF